MTRFTAAAIVIATVVFPVGASAHCDSTQGPVVTSARAALDAGDASLVLHWVRSVDEDAIRDAFRHAQAVRRLGPEAMALADAYFFETVVRIHRAGEGAAYEGLTDAAPEAIIAATDRALESGSTDELEQQLVSAVRTGLADRFAAARAARGFRSGDVAGGRAFVAAYVPLTHWVEGVFSSASKTGDAHGKPSMHGTGVHPQPVGEPPHRDDPHEGLTTGVDSKHGMQFLPWLLAGLFAIAASIEAVFLMRHRHRLST